MRAMLLAILVGCTGGLEHDISGTYMTNYDGLGGASCGGAPGWSCVEVTARDATGILDHDYFRDETIERRFSVHVPDGATGVQLVLRQHTADLHDHNAKVFVDGPVNDDLDLGLVTISHWP